MLGDGLEANVWLCLVYVSCCLSTFYIEETKRKMLELGENKSQVHVNKEGSMQRRSIWGEAQRGADARWKESMEEAA